MSLNIVSVNKKLSEGRNNQFITCSTTESFGIACQKIDGEHTFRHLNTEHDEILFVISGELSVWTSEGIHQLKTGDMLNIPRNIEHGDLFGRSAEILILEGRL